MDKFDLEELIKFISPQLRNVLRGTDKTIWKTAEEIRICIGKPISIIHNGNFTTIFNNDLPIMGTRQMIDETIMLITENSFYAATDKISNGYITIKGGHRVGICGTAVLHNEKVMTIKDISSINIRIRREVIGVAEKVIKHIVENSVIKNTLIISPPRRGKTTLLRDIARVIGKNHKISIIDERSEIAAVYNSSPQNDVGIYADVLDACPKSIGIQYVIRSMSPEVIITDEIGTELDRDAIKYAARSGVKVITTIHGNSVAELIDNKSSNSIVEFFDVFITLSSTGTIGSIYEILRRDEIAV